VTDRPGPVGPGGGAAPAPSRPEGPTRGTRCTGSAALLDPGSLHLLTPVDDSGMLAAVGTIEGSPVSPSAPTRR
jgi:acetyl-CoA/propionyl-CoA carboxylase carboxyl transferase subunit